MWASEADSRGLRLRAAGWKPVLEVGQTVGTGRTELGELKLLALLQHPFDSVWSQKKGGSRNVDDAHLIDGALHLVLPDDPTQVPEAFSGPVGAASDRPTTSGRAVKPS